MARPKQAKSTLEETPARPSDLVVAEASTVDLYDEESLRNLASFTDALALAASVNDGLSDASEEIGDGFALLDGDEKKRLVGVPLIMMEWTFHNGDFGSKFVSVRIVAKNPDGGISKYIINDGSTGICDTLAKFQESTGRVGGLVCRKGLRESTYIYCEECAHVVKPELDSEHAAAGKHKRATTFYIDSSAA